MYRHAIIKGCNSKKVWWIFLAFLVTELFFYPSFSFAQKTASNTPGKSSPGVLSMAWVRVKTHVRKQPLIKSQSLGVLGRGKLLIVLKKEKGWTEVQYELGKVGWVFNKNIAYGLPPVAPKADRILFVKDGIHGDKGIVEIYFNGAVGDKIKVFNMKIPSRLVLDVKGLKSSRNKRFLLDKTSLVSEIRVGIHPDKSRLVLNLKREVKKFSHSISGDKNAISLAILLGSPSKTPVRTVRAGKKKSVQKKKVAATVHPKPVRITKTGFMDEANRSAIILTVTSPPVYYVKFVKGKVGLILSNAMIDKKYTRFLDTSRFPTPVKKVEFKNVFDPKSGRRAEVWVTTSTKVPYDVVVGHRMLTWTFKKPREFVARFHEKVRGKTAKTYTLKNTVVQKGTNTNAVKSTTSGKKTKIKPKIVTSKPKYTGAKMTFDFQKADIHNVLRLISEVSNLNFVATDDVRGKITLRLKNVPWDQALDIILQSKGLGKEKIGNVLRIAPISKLKKEMQEKISSKKVVEKLEARITEYIPVNYTTANELSSKIKPILSSRGTVTVDERTNTLIVRDIPKKVADAKAMVKRLDTPTPEVLIESRIVEANKDFTREIGIKWGATYNRDTAHGNALSSDFPNALNVRGGATGQAGGGTTTGGTAGGTTTATTATGLLPMVNLPATASYGAIGVSLEQLADIFTLDAELTAMEDNGKGRIISSPRIATLDNKMAKIQQGLKIPYLKITEEGTVTTEFIEANLNMEVTPHVSNDKMVNMEIKVAKDTPDWSHLVQGVPSIDKKEAITNVMVRNGGVTAIGGIFTIEKSNSIHKVPLFGDIPVLGWAFRNKRVVRNRKELLIFISPKLIPLKGNR